MIKACMAAASAPVQILSATWSPPVWMKTNHDYRGYSRLRQEYLLTYVDYHYKYIINFFFFAIVNISSVHYLHSCLFWLHNLVFKLRVTLLVHSGMRDYFTPILINFVDFKPFDPN